MLHRFAGFTETISASGKEHPASGLALPAEAITSKKNVWISFTVENRDHLYQQMLSAPRVDFDVLAYMRLNAGEISLSHLPPRMQIATRDSVLEIDVALRLGACEPSNFGPICADFTNDFTRCTVVNGPRRFCLPTQTNTGFEWSTCLTSLFQIFAESSHCKSYKEDDYPSSVKQPQPVPFFHCLVNDDAMNIKRGYVLRLWGYSSWEGM